MSSFTFKDDIMLEDDKVKLCPLQRTDIQYLKQFAEQEPQLWKYSLAQIKNVQDLETYIEIAVQARIDEKEYPFIVYDKEKKRYAGSTRFYDIQLSFSTLQIGYTWYGHEFQGTSVNKRCKFLLLQYAFETMHMERVEFRADARNERSKQAMVSIGCTLEGTLRNHLPSADGGRRDSIILSILKEEWFGNVKEILWKKIS